MRQLALNEITSSHFSFKMLSLINDWGEDDEVISAIAKRGEFETEALSWWLSMCSTGSDSDIVIDAGAYTGIYSLAAVSGNPNLRAVAFEASAVTYGRLVANILTNNLELRIIPNHLALTDRAGPISLAHAFGIYTMSSGETISPFNEADHFEEVLGMSLDGCFQAPKGRLPGALGSKSLSVDSFRGIAAIKIDVEGAEQAVILGGMELLRKYQPSLIIEIFSDQRRTAIETTLEGLGYALVAECAGSNLVYCPRARIAELHQAHLATSSAYAAAFTAVRRILVAL